jgi:AmmeMemoRadiSam system protein B/AmmeMemoRadiSam system protein A
MKQDNFKKQPLIRKPAVAGFFYPANSEVLAGQIEELLNQAENKGLNKEIKMMILPHAGYAASGLVAATGFKSIQGKNFKNIFIINPSHQDWFSGVALDNHDFWQTPLGKVRVNQDLREKLNKEAQNIFIREKAHSQEHAAEIMLPFLQKILNDFKIIPLTVGQISKKEIFTLAQGLKKYLTEKDLIIISSDLSHYPDYETANQVDQQTIQTILSGQEEKFEKTIKNLQSQNLPGLDTCACGENAIKIGLILADLMKWKNIELLKYANSGDILEDKSRVVGYASIAFSIGDKEPKLSLRAKKKLIEIARESIKACFRGKDFEFNNIFQEIKTPQGAFVTLKKNGQLRGCLGRVIEEKQPLYKVVAEMARAAAFEDNRFTSLQEEEIEELDIEISVLSPLKKIKDPKKEIKIGQHGVVVSQGAQGGVFLPQVATENNWDLEEFMNNLCLHKAGLNPEAWKRGEVDIYVYTAEIFTEKDLE